jgi:hypothetical protein
VVGIIAADGGVRRQVVVPTGVEQPGKWISSGVVAPAVWFSGRNTVAIDKSRFMSASVPSVWMDVWI